MKKIIKQGENVILEVSLVDKSTNSPLNLTGAVNIVASLVSPNGMLVSKKYSLVVAPSNGVITIDSVVNSKIKIEISGADSATLTPAIYGLAVKVKLPDGGIGFNLFEFDETEQLEVQVGSLKSELIA